MPANVNSIVIFFLLIFTSSFKPVGGGGGGAYIRTHLKRPAHEIGRLKSNFELDNVIWVQIC